MEDINNIHQIMKELKPFKPKSIQYSKFENISTSNYIPPSYMVQILMLAILKFENLGRMEKVLWHTFFKYKNYIFMIRDYKFGSWSIEGLFKNEVSIGLVNEIKNKIIRASKLLDKVLYKALKSEIKKEKFYLHNVYYKLSSLYTFYEEKVLKAVKEDDKFKKKNENLKKIYDKEEEQNIEKKIINISKYLNAVFKIKHEQEKAISRYSFGMILSFFSLLEFLLDVLYAFEQHNEKFFEFRKKNWNIRFKSLLNFNKHKELKRIYEELLSIKKNYRNPLTHGLTNEISLLVPLASVGLIPLSYRNLSNKTYYSFFEIEKEDALRMIDLFREFLAFLENKEPYKFYILYLKCGFSIPIDANEISKIKKKMSSEEEFQEYIERESYIEDMFINRDF